jgi:CheY-like chemotaxis protein
MENFKNRITVLAVEDEVLLLDLTRTLLEKCGYCVLSACDGVEALKTAKEHPGPIDLLLTDVRMPRMGGRELVEEFKKLFPLTKVLYMTGNSSACCVEEMQIPESSVLCKPIDIGEFFSKVGSVLQPAF